jgi:hypothetical protein
MACGQDAQPGGDVMWAPAQAGKEGGQRGGPEGRRMGVFGKISAIGSDSIEVTGPEGNKVTLKLKSSTEFRKDRQPAKLSDFKVGDLVMVRTDQANGNPTTAVVVLSGQGGGPGGGGPGMMTAMGTLGKDYVLGEVKAIDAPRMTVLRTDNVSQTLELNEETSLRRGRDSITMPDIQVGDHVFARGAVENSVFVPKDVRVIPPEMWKRMQETNLDGASSGGGSAQPTNPSAPPVPPPSQSPPEPRN